MASRWQTTRVWDIYWWLAIEFLHCPSEVDIDVALPGSDQTVYQIAKLFAGDRLALELGGSGSGPIQGMR